MNEKVCCIQTFDAHLANVPSCFCMLILEGGPSITCYHPHLIIKLFQCELNHVLMWSGIVEDWCALAEAGLGGEVENYPPQFVNIL